MANEATCIETPTKFARYTCADGNALPIGTLLKLSDPNTASATSADNDKFAGIAWVEKVANDGVTEIVAALDGVWDMTDAGAGITVGNVVKVGGANTIMAAPEASMIIGELIGKTLEQAGASEVVRVRVGSII